MLMHNNSESWVASAAIVGKATAVWFVMLVLAIANGGVREKVLVPFLGKTAGLVASGLLLSALIFGVTYFAVGWFTVGRPAHYAVIGASWLTATLAFEVAFGRFVAGRTWRELAEAYSFAGGNLWPIVLVIIAISPWACARLRGLA